MRGGKREGAGRKPNPGTKKVPISLKISQDIHQYLTTVDNKTAAVENAIMQSGSFRAWKRQL